MSIRILRAKKRKSLRSKLASVIMGAAALAIISFLVISNWRIYKDRRAMDAEVAKLEEQIQILEERRANLQAGLAAVQGENFQEEKMREQGYKKPGEQVIAVLQDSPANATKQEGISGDSFWTDFWKKIKGIK